MCREVLDLHGLCATTRIGMVKNRRPGSNRLGIIKRTSGFGVALQLRRRGIDLVIEPKILCVTRGGIGARIPRCNLEFVGGWVEVGNQPLFFLQQDENHLRADVARALDLVNDLGRRFILCAGVALAERVKAIALNRRRLPREGVLGVYRQTEVE